VGATETDGVGRSRTILSAVRSSTLDLAIVRHWHRRKLLGFVRKWPPRLEESGVFLCRAG